MTEYLYDVISVILIIDFGVFLLVAASFFSSFLLIPITGVLLTVASIGIGLDAIYYVVLPSLIGSKSFGVPENPMRCPNSTSPPSSWPLVDNLVSW